MNKNVYLVSNTFKSFYLFRREIISELSKTYNLVLIGNNDEYVNYFLNKNINCISLDNLFNNKSLIKNFQILFKFIFLFLKKKPHLVQTYTIHPNLIICPLAKIFSSKTITMITGMGAVFNSKNYFLKKFFNYLYKISFKFCDYIIFVNNHDKNYFIKKLNIFKPYIQIYGAGILEKKVFKKNFICDRYALTKSFNILYIGRLIEEKGFIDAIKVFKKVNIKNKKLIIVGDFDKLGFTKKNNYSILKYPGIIWIKNIRDISKVLLFADTFLFPSKTEGMPTVLMEAINYNIPTITYLIPGVEDIIKNNLNGYVHRIGKIHSLENSLIKIYKSKKKNHFNYNYSKLISKFKRKNIIVKILNFYEHVLKQ